MKTLLLLLSAGFFGILLSPSFAYAQSSPKEEMRGVKITNVASDVLFDDKSIEQAVHQLHEWGFNAILPVVWNGAKTQYPSQVMEDYMGYHIDDRMTGRDPLQRIIIEAHKYGMEVYPWFEYGFAAWYAGNNTATSGGPILERYPDWASRNADNSLTLKNGFVWMNGINPDVQTFMNELVLEVVDRYDVDGIEFSDRIPALPVEGGYDEATVEIYKNEKGENPPQNHNSVAWIEWRADKLTDWYEQLKDSVKKRDPRLIVASSPSVFPWGYTNYLQDNVSWIERDIIDHYIPQLYRYNIGDYEYELRRALQQIPVDKQDRLFAGILMNVGSYIASPSYMRSMMDKNRDYELLGEAFFFYEGLRKNSNELGTLLKEEYYHEPASIPLRNGFVRQPGAWFSFGKDAAPDDWTFSGTVTIDQDSVFTGDLSVSESLSYSFSVPTPGWYNLFYYSLNAGDRKIPTEVQITHANEDTTVNFESDANKGWQEWKTVFIEDELTVEISTHQQAQMYAPGLMLQLNRKLSPEVEIPLNSERNPFEEFSSESPLTFQLDQNYPNPFNPRTQISFHIEKASRVELSVYDLLGRKITTLINAHTSAGNHSLVFDGSELSSGIYMYTLTTDSGVISRKMTLMK